jgi:RNA polymerase sigma-70 factor (ECF subfamily)
MTLEARAKSTSLVQTRGAMAGALDPIDVERVFRQERARVLATLVRTVGDFVVAEDALQDAFVAALRDWPAEGLPRSPAAWLTTVARNRAASVRRHDAVVQSARAAHDGEFAEIDLHGEDVPDDRLRLIFCACHPALAEEARVALALQTLCGLPAAAIARLFLVPEATVAQRLVRAKRKIRDAGIPFAIPAPDRFDERLDAVLSVIYLLFTEGYAPTDGDLARSAPLCDEAIRLGRVLCHLLPTQSEARGLLALMLLHDARRAARVDASADPIPLEEQDRSQWNASAIAEGVRHLEDALARGRPGPYQIQGSIAALHATAARAEDTDWVQIMALYEELDRRSPSPSVALALVVAEAMAFSADLALERLQRLERAGRLAGSDRVPAVRADLLRRAGRMHEAMAAYEVAASRARNEREAAFLRRRARTATE